MLGWVPKLGSNTLALSFVCFETPLLGYELDSPTADLQTLHHFPSSVSWNPDLSGTLKVAEDDLELSIFLPLPPQ